MAFPEFQVSSYLDGSGRGKILFVTAFDRSNNHHAAYIAHVRASPRRLICK